MFLDGCFALHKFKNLGSDNLVVLVIVRSVLADVEVVSAHGYYFTHSAIRCVAFFYDL